MIGAELDALAARWAEPAWCEKCMLRHRATHELFDGGLVFLVCKQCADEYRSIGGALKPRASQPKPLVLQNRPHALQFRPRAGQFQPLAAACLAAPTARLAVQAARGAQ